MQKWKMEDMQLQKQRLESESKKEEQSRKQHQDLMQVMLQQTKQQQEHKQNTALKKLLRFGDYKCMLKPQYCAKEMQTKFGVLRSLFSRKFDEISSKRSRIFVESGEISLSTC